MPADGENKKKDSSWKEASTLEDWVRKAIEDGRGSQVIALIRTLPEASRKKYRKIWNERKN